MHPSCLSFCWKRVLVMTNCCSVQNSSSNRPLSLQLPTLCLQSTLFQESASWPTLALKSPRIITLLSALEIAAELQVELVFFLPVHLEELACTHWKAWHTAYFQRKVHGHHAMKWLVGRFSSLKAMQMLTMKPMPERRPSVVGFPDQKRVYLAPCSWRLPSPEKQTSLRAAMSTFNLDSSCAIRAEQHSGHLL